MKVTKLRIKKKKKKGNEIREKYMEDENGGREKIIKEVQTGLKEGYYF